jgi:hypothetical protein
MKFADLIESKTELDKNKLWQDTLNEYYLKLSNVNQWLLFERRRLIIKYGAFCCPLPAWFNKH